MEEVVDLLAGRTQLGHWGRERGAGGQGCQEHSRDGGGGLGGTGERGEQGGKSSTQRQERLGRQTQDAGDSLRCHGKGWAGTGQEGGHSGTCQHQDPHSQGMQGAQNLSRAVSGGLGDSDLHGTRGNTTQEPRREAWGLTPQPEGVLTVQSGHDGLAQREHQPQRGAEEEEAGYLKVKAGAGALRPIQRCRIASRCLCLQRGLTGLQAATAEPVGTGKPALHPLQPRQPRGAAGSRGATAGHCTSTTLPPRMVQIKNSPLHGV